MRIISLLPSATEIVCALGGAGQLVGRSHECDFPAWVERLPVCSEPNFTPGSSRAIDDHVRAMVRQALSIYRLHDDVIRALRPDVILTQSQCEVCAVSQRDVERATCDWLDSAAAIVSLEPNGLEDVFADIARVGEALGAPERAGGLIAALRQRMGAIADRARDVPARPTVACLEWLDPLIVSGNWMPDLVEMAGGVNLFSQADLKSPRIAWDDLRAHDPEMIVLLPCGFGIARGRQDLPLLRALPGWAALRAVRTGRVYLTDGHQYFNRPGPRLVESLEMLAEMLHPEAFAFGHEGSGWQRV
ncbi:MAG TPA: cobalamin-binding protein [Ktedonobacterales bacterium]|nr:cobalamin-binding protein [Ktedonobacterales bacterium]